MPERRDVAPETDRDIDHEIDEVLEPERYELREKPPYRFAVDRRRFLGVTGTGLLITATAAVVGAQRRRREEPTLSARLHIAEDGALTVMTSKVEMGQGSRTQLIQAVAEEMGVPVDRIQLVMADTDSAPRDGGTVGSRTTPSTVPAVRRAAAAAREILIAKACEEWKTGRPQVELRDGAVLHRATKRRLTYTALARSNEMTQAYQRAVPSDISLTRMGDWKVLGTSPARVGGRELVTGAHRYPSDIVRPNMLYGKILRPPSYGATLSSIDLAPAREGKAVTVVHEGNFVGCAASTALQAQRAVAAVAKTARWERPR
ncbi:MAG: molybdopterin-dependent oxidoreductase, partial [Acidobacteria bacterium]|nr:molybdopterin-dependent oxidoreductase [Acidobacteriota bacterium]